jgi:hypothetical protein
MILLPYEKHFVDEIDALHAFEKLGSALTNSAHIQGTIAELRNCATPHHHFEKKRGSTQGYREHGNEVSEIRG